MTVLTTLIISLGQIITGYLDATAGDSTGLFWVIWILFGFGVFAAAKNCDVSQLWTSIIISIVVVFISLCVFHNATVNIDNDAAFMERLEQASQQQKPAMSFALTCVCNYIPLIIYAIWRFVHRTCEIAGEAVYAAVNWVVTQFLDLLTLKSIVRQKKPNAIKMLVTSTDTKHVNVHLWESVGLPNPTSTVTIDANAGVSDDICEGVMYDLTY